MKKTLLILPLLTSLSLSAEIIDNETELAGSFKDTASGIVWMDFNVNNDDSYYDVVEELKDGGKYYGWRLPTRDEVSDLFYNLVNAEYAGATTDYSNGGEYGERGYTSTWLNPGSGWDSAFLAMGIKIKPPYPSDTVSAFYPYPHSEGQYSQFFGRVMLTDSTISTDAIFYHDRATNIPESIPDSPAFSMLLVLGTTTTVEPEIVEPEIVENGDSKTDSSKSSGGAFSYILSLMLLFRLARLKK